MAVLSTIVLMNYDIKPGYRENYKKVFSGRSLGRRTIIAWSALGILVAAIFYMSYAVRKPAVEKASNKPAAEKTAQPNANEPATPEQPAPAVRKLTVKAALVNVRSTPAVETGNVIGQASGGETMELISEEGDWFKVKTENGQEGYVFNSPQLVEEVK
ncbi:MAG: SH3 domain-containing protein [Candidatus Aquicultorales bacterium]